jgi:hypothetical protein
MSLLTPLALLSALVIGPIIVAMYMLKLRRTERTVSSTFLWKRMVRDVEANTPWQRLRFNWLLLLQILLLLLLVLALARPFFLTAGISGRNLILVIDRSASMAAVDGAPTRLDSAKQQAFQLVDQLPDGGRATVIAAGGQLEVPVSSTTDRRLLRDSINAIQISNGGGSDLGPALTLAGALAAREPDSEIAVLSDGNVSLPSNISVPATVRYFPIGERNDNVAISALALQPSAGGQTFFAQTTNYGPAPVTRRLDVFLDGVLFNAYNVTIEPGREQAIIEDVPASVRLVEARLAPPEGQPSDALPLDDQVWAASTVGEGTTVRVVGPGNRFLETALDLLPGLNVRLAPATTTVFTETAAQVPVTILDSVIPATLPPGNLLFIGPVRSTEFFSVTGEIEFPGLRPVPGDEPLLRNVSLSEVSVLRAARVAPGAWARVVVDGDGGPLLLAGERDGRRIAVLTFDITNSDLPLQVAFPLLISNLISYLAPGSGAEASQVEAGQPITVPVDQSITLLRVTKPDGSVVDVVPEGGQMLFGDTNAFGPYIVEEFRGDELVARIRYTVNLYAPDESQVARQDALNVQQVSGLQQATTGEQVGREEFWRWLAIAALVVLVVEWLVYQRNALIYLRERFLQRRASETSSGTPR